MGQSSVHIYHITHIGNLAAIIQAGGLYAKSRLDSQRTNYKDIAHQHIQSRRARTRVPCGPRGTLQEYVPFYFASRSPMLFANYSGRVQGNQDGQLPIVHLVSTVKIVQGAAIPFVFTDGHATVALTDFYDDVANLDKIDWPLMRAKMWSDIPEDNDRSRRRQAEFLVRDFFPWELVKWIGVINSDMLARTERVLQTASHKPIVDVRPHWYY